MRYQYEKVHKWLENKGCLTVKEKNAVIVDIEIYPNRIVIFDLLTRKYGGSTVIIDLQKYPEVLECIEHWECYNKEMEWDI